MLIPILSTVIFLWTLFGGALFCAAEEDCPARKMPFLTFIGGPIIWFIFVLRFTVWNPFWFAYKYFTRD